MEADQGIDNKVVKRRLKMGLTLHPAYPLFVTSPFTYCFGRGLHLQVDACWRDIFVTLAF